MNFNPIAIFIVSFLEKIKILSPKRLIKLKYILKFHRKPNLKTPKDLNEKIIWLSFNSDTSNWTDLADKYKVRTYVEERGLGKLLVKLYGVYEHADDIDFDKLPDSFVLKTNNGSGTVILVDNKKKLNIEKAKQKLNKWLKIPFGLMSAEPHYRRIKPCIIAEEFLKEGSTFSTSLIDYKFWCFDGIPYYVFTAHDRDIEHHKASFGLYKIETWELLNSFISAPFRNDQKMPKPTLLPEMIEYAKILAEGFPQVRVDFYEVEGKVYFGELTFTSNGGLMAYFTRDFLLTLGDKVKI